MAKVLSPSFYSFDFDVDDFESFGNIILMGHICHCEV